MSSEPERPIEKLLHAFAKERRESAKGPWPLHPATRKLLQGEVARRLGTGQKSRTPFMSWLLHQVRLRPFGTISALAVPIVAVLLVLPLVLTKYHASLKENPQRAESISPPSPAAPDFKDALAFNEPKLEPKTQKELLTD